MTTSIWKYPLTLGDVDGEQLIAMPRGAKILTLAKDPRGDLCIWAAVEPDAPRVRRLIIMFGTGEELGNWDAEYARTSHIGTIVGQLLVWHFFDCGET